MKKIFALLATISLASCGGDGGGGSGGGIPSERPNGQVAGVAHDNILVNADINIYSLGKELLGSGTTNEEGIYNIQLESVESQIVLVEATNGRYIEEFSGKSVELKEGDSLRAYVYYEQAGNIDMSVTLLSTIAVGYSEYLMSLGVPNLDAVSQSNASISTMAGIDIEAITPVDITNVANANPSLNDQLKYSFITAAVSPLMAWVSKENNTPIHDRPFNSIHFAEKAYDDIRHDGKLDGQGTEGGLAFGVTPISTETYRSLAVNMLIMANDDNNVTGIDAEDLLDFASQFNASNHPAFGAEQSPPAPLNSISPNVTNFSWSEGETIAATVTLSVDVVDQVGVDAVSLNIGGIDYVAANPDKPEFLVDTTSFVDGVYTAEITATSATTGITKVSRTVTIANAGIAVSDVHPQDGEYIRGNYSFSAVVTDPIEVVDVQFQIDDNIYYSQSTLDNPVQILNTTQVIVTETAHTFKVTAENQAGYTTSVTNTFYLDNTDPQISTSLNNDSYITDDYNFQATISDNLKVDDVVLYLDGSVVSDLSDSIFSNTYSLNYPMTVSEMDEGEHIIAVDVSDKAGNNTQLSRSFIIDNFAPELAITTLGGGATQSDYVISWESSDNLGLTGHKIYIDGIYKQALSASTQSISLNGEGNQGLKTVTVEAADVAGRISSDSTTYYFDYTSPTVASWGLSDGVMLPAIYSDSISVSDNTIIKSVDLKLDGVSLGVDSDVGSNFTRQYSLTRSQLTEGTHTLTLKSVDVAGNETEASKSFIVDNFAPSVSISTVAGVVTGSYSISWSASDAVGIASQKIYIDGSLHATLNGSARSTTITPSGSESNRTITVEVIDTSGKTSSDSVSKTYRHIAPSFGSSSYETTTSGYGKYKRIKIAIGGVSSGESVSISATPVREIYGKFPSDMFRVSGNYIYSQWYAYGTTKSIWYDECSITEPEYSITLSDPYGLSSSTRTTLNSPKSLVDDDDGCPGSDLPFVIGF